RLGELLDPDGLQQAGHGAGLDRGPHRDVGAVAGQHHDLDVGELLAHERGGGDAVDAGHRQVHEHDVDVEPGAALERLDRALGHADHLDVVAAGQHRCDALADQRVVVDDQDPDPVGVGAHGSTLPAALSTPAGHVNTTSVPWPGALTTRRSPSTPAARSR